MPFVDIHLMTAIHQRNVMEFGVLLKQWPNDDNDHMFNCALWKNYDYNSVR